MAQLEHPLLAELARRGALGVVGGLPLQEFLEDLRGDQLVHQTALRQNLEALSVGGACQREVLLGLLLLVAAKAFTVRVVVGAVDSRQVAKDCTGERPVELILLGECECVLELRPRVLEAAHDARADAPLLIGGAPLVRGHLIVERDLLEDQVGLGGVVVLHEGATLK